MVENCFLWVFWVVASDGLGSSCSRVQVLCVIVLEGILITCLPISQNVVPIITSDTVALSATLSLEM